MMHKIMLDIDFHSYLSLSWFIHIDNIISKGKFILTTGFNLLLYECVLGIFSGWVGTQIDIFIKIKQE